MEPDFKIRECRECCRLIFRWIEGRKHIKKHKWKVKGIYSTHFNYYKRNEKR